LAYKIYFVFIATLIGGKNLLFLKSFISVLLKNIAAKQFKARLKQNDELKILNLAQLNTLGASERRLARARRYQPFSIHCS
jgi:hypothetical protein